MGRDPLANNAVRASVDVSVEDYVGDDGTIVIPDGVTLTSFLDRNRAAFGDQPSYRFLDYSSDADGRVVELSWNGLWARVSAVGARLQQVTQPRDRVAILAPQGVDYVAAFFAAIHAGNVAVPLFAPSLAGHNERLSAVLADAQPTVVLTTSSAAESVRNILKQIPAASRPRVIAVDAVPDSVADMFTPPTLNTDDVAYLQYTSGSTRTPAGVQITHRNVCTNVIQMILTGDLDLGVRSVSWLPLYHDMGLIMIMFPALCGSHITLMDPMAFVRRPYRWIKQLGIEAAHGRTFAAAPNFAFELVAERGRPPQGETLDLTNVVTLLNGSEPVTMTAIEKFTTAFAPYGLPATAIKPSYGMAEATLSVASISSSDAASARYFDRDQLSDGRAVIVDATDPGAVEHVSCGNAIPNQWLVITDGDGNEVPEGRVGEIWLHGNNVGLGYFGRPDETERVFGNKLQTRLETDSHAVGVADNAYWLATGDLGTYVDGVVYLTGRIKDMIIVDGRNHYPTDIETTVGLASPAVRSGYVAAFAIPGDRGEQLVIVAERAAGAGRTEPGAVVDTVRAAVSRRHQVRIADLRFVAAGTIPRTTSGKLARSACRAEYLAGRFDRYATAQPDRP